MFAHELGNRLAIISSYLELATQDVADRDALQDSLRRTSRAVADLSDLSLEWMRLGAHEVGPGVHEELDLVEVVRHVLARADALYLGAGRRVSLSTEVPSVRVSGERVALERLFENVVNNALKYSGDTTTVDVEVRLDGDQVSVAVVDHGIGMSDDDQARVFEPFYRSADAVGRHIRGSGLGLSICRSVVQAHAGELSLSSTLGQGSRVSVRLPVITT